MAVAARPLLPRPGTQKGGRPPVLVWRRLRRPLLLSRPLGNAKTEERRAKRFRANNGSLKHGNFKRPRPCLNNATHDSIAVDGKKKIKLNSFISSNTHSRPLVFADDQPRDHVQHPPLLATIVNANDMHRNAHEFDARHLMINHQHNYDSVSNTDGLSKAALMAIR